MYVLMESTEALLLFRVLSYKARDSEVDFFCDGVRD